MDSTAPLLPIVDDDPSAAVIPVSESVDQPVAESAAESTAASAVRQLDKPASGWHAELELAFERRAGDSARTTLVLNRHSGPLRVQKALYPEGEGICHVVMLHPPAGVAGGDRLDIDLRVGDGAHAVLSTPGATKWYKSQGRPARQRVRVQLQRGARLDWLPQENILFDQSQPRLSFDLDLAEDACAIVWEACVLGRGSSGERWSTGDLKLDTRLRRNGRSLWTEQAGLDARSALRDSELGLAGFPVFGTLWAVGIGAGEELAEACASWLPFDDQLRAGVSWLPEPGAAHQTSGLLLVRVLGRHIEAVRTLMIRLWTELRPAVLGVPARPLRLWAT